MPAMRSYLLLAGLAVVAPWPAAAQVTLRPFGMLSGPVVRLSDLFDGAGAAGRRILGPGPAPGEEITVPAAQLAAIAQEFGVAWRPNSPAEQAVLERPGRQLRRSEASAALTPALVASGAPPHCGVVLTNFGAPEVPPGAKVSVSVRALDFDPASRRFSAVLSVAAQGMDSVEVPVSGRTEAMVRVVLATRSLMPGTIVEAADLKVSEVPTSQVSSAVVREPAAAEGLELVRAVGAGEPLALADLTAPPLVKRGQDVLITLVTPGLSLTEQGKTLGSGAKGATVHVLNPASHALLAATVTGPGEVSVALGSMPLRGPDRGARRPYRVDPEYAAR